MTYKNQGDFCNFAHLGTLSLFDQSRAYTQMCSGLVKMEHICQDEQNYKNDKKPWFL